MKDAEIVDDNSDDNYDLDDENNLNDSDDDE